MAGGLLGGAQALLWAALISLSCLRMVSSANCFVGSMIIVNNSVDRSNLNRVNGVCQGVTALRCKACACV